MMNAEAVLSPRQEKIKKVIEIMNNISGGVIRSSFYSRSTWLSRLRRYEDLTDDQRVEFRLDTEILGQFFEEATEFILGEKFQCLLCDGRFTLEDPPEVCAILRPISRSLLQCEVTPALTYGVCASCASEGELRRRLNEAYRSKLGYDLQRLDNVRAAGTA